jgi:hypothetical protein
MFKNKTKPKSRAEVLDDFDAALRQAISIACEHKVPLLELAYKLEAAAQIEHTRWALSPHF